MHDRQRTPFIPPPQSFLQSPPLPPFCSASIWHSSQVVLGVKCVLTPSTPPASPGMRTSLCLMTTCLTPDKRRCRLGVYAAVLGTNRSEKSAKPLPTMSLRCNAFRYARTSESTIAPSRDDSIQLSPSSNASARICMNCRAFSAACSGSWTTTPSRTASRNEWNFSTWK
jgi:hypothetical protein